MKTGEVIDGRFVIDIQVGAGGMGVVYRATDRSTGQRVAVKLLRESDGSGSRFLREAHALAELSHPGIVRHVAHGTHHERPFLVLEWLEGQDLAQRLKAGPLSIGEALDLVERAATALGHAHRRGNIHRDVKPANLFLRGGDPADVVVIDFGLAFVQDATTTRSGMAMGSPMYMAPEQARGDRVTTAQTDVYGLGCVLFECIAGHPPFQGDHVMAVLAQILMSEPPALRDLQPGVSPELSGLTAAMLSKETSRRPADGQEVAAAIADLRSRRSRSARAMPSTIPPPLGLSEQLVMSVLVLGAGLPDQVLDQTVHRLVASDQGRLENLRDGSRLLALSSKSGGVDRARRLVHCAARTVQLLGQVTELVPVAVVTGRVGQRGQAVGVVMERAAEMLRVPIPNAVRLDESTARMVDDEFDVARDEHGWFVRVNPEAVIARNIRPSVPCLGRDFELSQLMGLYRRSVDEPVSTAAIIIGPAGNGKSRVCGEFELQLRQQAEPPRIWRVNCDATSAETSLRLAADLTRCIGEAKSDEPVLSELGSDVHTRVESGAPQRKLEAISAAFASAVHRVAADRPLVILIDDLHCADVPSLSILAAVLAPNLELPLMIVGTARPTDDALPLASTVPNQVVLGPLAKGSSRRLVQALLPPEKAEKHLDRILERGAGHPFLLEELAWAASVGAGDLPDTVLATVHARLERVSAPARRVLRAASIFGRTFWDLGIASLLGGQDLGAVLSAQLHDLQAAGFVAVQDRSRYVGAREFRFCHDLTGEAVYETLPEEERVAGHRAAGMWLSRCGEKEPAMLASHFERAKEPARTVKYARAAAHLAVEGDDLVAASRWYECALAALSNDPPEEVRMRAKFGQVLAWRGDLNGAVEQSERAWKGRDVEPWLGHWAASTLSLCLNKLGRLDEAEEVVAALMEHVKIGLLDEQVWEAVLGAATGMANHGKTQYAKDALELADSCGPWTLERSPRVCLAYQSCRAFYHAGARPDLMVDALGQARRAATLLGDLRRAQGVGTNLGFGWIELGRYDEAIEILEACLAECGRLNLEELWAHTESNLALALARRACRKGDTPGMGLAAERQLAVAAKLDGLGNFRLAAMARLYAAEAFLEMSDPERARASLRVVTAIDQRVPTRNLAIVHALLAWAALQVDEVKEANEQIGFYREKRGQGPLEEYEELCGWIEIEVLSAVGDLKKADVRRDWFITRIETLASAIEDPTMRKSFRLDIPVHCRLLAQAGASVAAGSGL